MNFHLGELCVQLLAEDRVPLDPFGVGIRPRAVDQCDHEWLVDGGRHGSWHPEDITVRPNLCARTNMWCEGEFFPIAKRANDRTALLAVARLEQQSGEADGRVKRMSADV